MPTSKSSPSVRSAVRLIALLGASLAVLLGACGGKVVIDQEGKGGADGSVANSSSSDAVGTTVASGSLNVSVGQGGGGLPQPCIGCAEFVTGGEGPLCPASQALYDKLIFCVCATDCIPQCTDNACSGAPPSDACNSCWKKACQDEFATCSNDVF